MQHSFGVIQLTFDPQPGHVVLCHDNTGRTFVVELIEPLEVQHNGSIDYWLAQGPSTNLAQGPSTEPGDWMTLDADLFVGLLHSSFEVEL